MVELADTRDLKSLDQKLWSYKFEPCYPYNFNIGFKN